MTCNNALAYIHNTLKFGSKPGLERIGKLLELMENPQDSLKFIHVAGTNGKGSTANAVAASLIQSGFKTGLYTSPYVIDFRERIQINGNYIREDELAAEVEYIKPFVEKVTQICEQPTEFEIITALAFDYLKRQGCDAVVLEVGLGGRFDATNIIKKPLVSVITSISYDHTAILGDTLDKIAFEKCGIIKEGGVTVASPGEPTEALEVIMRACALRSNELVMPNLNAVKVLKEGIDGTDIQYGDAKLHIPLTGRHQIVNFITAYEALLTLRKQGFAISNDDIKKGMANVRFPARMEILNRSPLVILDGAHNPAGADTLAESIKRYLKEKPVLIMGMLADKNYKKSIGTLAPLAKAFIAVRPDSPRALDPKITAQTAAEFCRDTAFFEDHEKAFDTAIKKSEKAPIIICGSLYLAGIMRSIVLQNLKK